MSLRRATELILNLVESRNVEVKSWIDPNTNFGKAKIVKGVLALRNFNGGYFVVGFDDSTLEPDFDNVPEDVGLAFHNDTIQGIVSHYASEPFDISVYFPERDGQTFPVISVPPGVRSPVATKRDLHDTDGLLIGRDEVYFRTLQSNNTVSTAKIPHKDWPELMRICFDNQEADIGRFLRRHLGGMSTEAIAGLRDAIAGVLAPTDAPEQQLDELEDDGGQRGFLTPTATMEHQLDELLNDGERRYLDQVAQRLTEVPAHGSFEVALIVMGNVQPRAPNRDFLQLLDASNPNLNGWPAWLNSRGFAEEENRPYVVDRGWEALIIDLEDVFGGRHLEFMRKDPCGKFYLRRALQDDLSQSARAPTPCTELDFGISILRVAEVIAVGMAFAEALGCDRDNTTLEFAFRWKGLHGRRLTSWAQPLRFIGTHPAAMQDEITCRVSVPLDTPPDAIHNYTQQVIAELFSLFGGFEITQDVVADLVSRMLERRL